MEGAARREQLPVPWPDEHVVELVGGAVPQPPDHAHCPCGAVKHEDPTHYAPRHFGAGRLQH
eukprot:2849374-Pyramimonas_sp.AAC.1